MAKQYGTLPVDFIRKSTTLQVSGAVHDLSNIQQERLGNKWTRSRKDYITNRQVDIHGDSC
jgi:hypothetical protein